jgi:glucan 1,3-beta-glucosidase
VETAIFANQLPATVLESSVITLDNIGVLNVGTMIGFVDGNVLDINPTDLNFLIVGNIQDGGSAYGMYNFNANTPDLSMLDSSSRVYYREQYFSKSRPQYEGLTTTDVINVKDHGAKGDGSTDDTANIQAVLAMATVDNLIYFPAGSYIVTSK